MDTDIGNGFQPRLRGGIEGHEWGEIEPGEEVFFDIADRVFHAPLFMGLAEAARGDGEAVVIGKIKIGGIEQRGLADLAGNHCGFKVIDHDLCRDAAKGGKGVLMAGEKVLHGLRDGELQVHHPAVAKDDHKEAEPAAG